MTVTVPVPAVVGVPVIVPEPEIEVPAGRPVAVKLSVWPPVLSLGRNGHGHRGARESFLRARGW